VLWKKKGRKGMMKEGERKMNEERKKSLSSSGITSLQRKVNQSELHQSESEDMRITQLETHSRFIT